MILRELAHARAGDKGGTSDVTVVARDPADWARLCAAVTVEAVRAHLADLPLTSVERHELPGLLAIKLVLHGALGAGVTRSLALDAHGKSLSSCLLAMPIEEG